MRFCSLGSGSEGNALIVQTPTTCIMIDCGLGWRELQQRLAQHGLSPTDISAIFITHEHADHIGGVDKIAARTEATVYASYGTFNGAPSISHKLPRLSPFDSHATTAIAVGDLHLTPYTVPHDAKEPTQYVVQYQSKRLGILTDAGSITPMMIDALQHLDALILEFNHDEKMLRDGKYPASLKRRVGGQFGHLSNHQASQLLRQIDQDKLQHVVAAHLSQSNNHPDLVEDCLASALAMHCQYTVATQSSGFDWLSIQ